MTNALLVVVLAVTGVGSCLLGIVAISDIKHSQGRITGIGLAFFDAIFFPLVVLDGVIVALGMWMNARVSRPDAVSPWPIILTGLAILIADVFILVLAWRAVFRQQAQRNDSQRDESETPHRGGRDWVTLSREQIDNEHLPDCCIVCGQHTLERVNKDFWYQSDWAGVLTMVGFFCGVLPAFIIGPLTTHTIRVACPVCPTHRDASRRLVWIASTGWLAAPVLALIGFGLAYPLVGIEVPAVLVAPSLGVVIGLVAYLVPVIRLWRQTVQTVGVEWMTSDYVRFRGVSATFAREAAQMSGAPQSDSAVTGQPPHSPSAIRTAWDDWWAERDQWLTSGVQSVLGIGFFVCLILYFSFYTSSERLPETDGQRLRHTIVTIGVPDPWFKWETYPDKRTPFQWKIDWISTSTGIMLLGFLAWCANWQIEKAKAKATGKKLRWWHGSPNFGIAVWGVLTLAAIVMGIAVAELPQRLDRRAKNDESRPPEQQAERDSDEATMTPPRAAKGSLELTLRRELVDDLDRSIRAAGDTSEKKAATGENTAAVPEPSTLIS